MNFTGTKNDILVEIFNQESMPVKDLDHLNARKLKILIELRDAGYLALFNNHLLLTPKGMDVIIGKFTSYSYFETDSINVCAKTADFLTNLILETK